MIKDRSIKGKDFLKFLKELQAKVEGPCYLLLDNASIHKPKFIQEFIGANEWKVAFIPPYCPDFQPIELAWALIKAKFKKLMLQEMLAGKQRC